MGRSRIFHSDTNTFSIRMEEDFRMRLTAASIIRGMNGKMNILIREVLENYLDKFVAENQAQYDLVLSSLRQIAEDEIEPSDQSR